MKKLVVSVLLICLLTVPALAVDFYDFQYRHPDGYLAVDVDAYLAAVAEEKVAESGLDIDVDSFWYLDENDELKFDHKAFDLAYEAALAALEVPEEIVVDDPIEDPDQAAVGDADSDYPLGSNIDESGNVYSPDGDLLNSDASTDLGEYSEDPDLDLNSDAEDLPEVIEDYFPVVYAVSDLRSGDSFADGVVSGLKALIISIFGEYTPVMTTLTVTETIDGVTTTTLIDGVAEGAAGVDFEWLAGVFLFGILLYCLMKLLGGVLK